MELENLQKKIHKANHTILLMIIYLKNFPIPYYLNDH